MGMMVSEKYIVKRFGEIDGLSAGGKAFGLTRLYLSGMNVPPAFIVIPDEDGGGEEELYDAYKRLGEGPVAVRPSAAGQYETFLNIEGMDELRKSVKKCFSAAESERVKVYQQAVGNGYTTAIAVVVQKMVSAVKAGVIFTVDPVSGSKGTLVIEAAEGLGEELVGGQTEGIRYSVNKAEGELQYQASFADGLLSREEINLLVQDAVKAEKTWGIPLDLEWAIDGKGIIHWLQARPITTLTDENLDTPISDNELVTRCNIGEMLPGAATPLTLSVFAESLDWGQREMFRREGVFWNLNSDEIPRFINHVDNHLFMNLTSMSLAARAIAGTSREAIELNVIGKVLQPYDIGPKAPGIIRLINGVRYFLLIFRHSQYLKRIKKLGRTFRMPVEGKTPEELYRDLCFYQNTVLNKTYFYHYCVSSYSGTMNGILAAVLSGGREITMEAHSEMGILLTDIPGIESADVIGSLQTLAGCIIKAGKKEQFLNLNDTEAVTWINNPAQGEIYERYRAFIDRHGHRCIREADLRSRDYATYPEEVVKTVRDILSSYADIAGRSRIPSAPKEKKDLPRWLLKQAKEGVRQREYSKSMLILVQHQFKKAYRKLSGMLTESKTIPDEDLIYFFTREEIGVLIEGKGNQDLIRKALKRRSELPYLMNLVFPEVSRGRPRPVGRTSEHCSSGSVLQGTPVSSGIVKGRIRIVRTLECAYELKPGEIMVAPFTDIGWTPFFSIISGLITEIGGALSHGAVVAREYGIPMVSNISAVTDMLDTGMTVRIDGRSGTVDIVAE